jgi:hypothetical protein|tara:strand:+ start:842 stop:1129 length:288 start_codon:yes stop_codon:yes gene_type:complete
MSHSPKLGESTPVLLDIKTIGIIIGFVVSLSTVYFTLKSDIALAMEMPEPPISKTEYELNDKFVRQTIMDTQDDVKTLLLKFDKMEERIYELTKR